MRVCLANKSWLECQFPSRNTFFFCLSLYLFFVARIKIFREYNLLLILLFFFLSFSIVWSDFAHFNSKSSNCYHRKSICIASMLGFYILFKFFFCSVFLSLFQTGMILYGGDTFTTDKQRTILTNIILVEALVCVCIRRMSIAYWIIC